jgi:hypothetical protein
LLLWGGIFGAGSWGFWWFGFDLRGWILGRGFYSELWIILGIFWAILGVLGFLLKYPKNWSWMSWKITKNTHSNSSIPGIPPDSPKTGPFRSPKQRNTGSRKTSQKPQIQVKSTTKTIKKSLNGIEIKRLRNSQGIPMQENFLHIISWDFEITLEITA